MKIEHWVIKGRDVETIASQTVDLHSVGNSGDKFELTGQVSYDRGTSATLDTLVTITLTRDEYELFLSMRGASK